MAFTAPIFTKNHACSTNVLKNSDTQFEEHQSSGLYADSKRHTD